ncbi:hypothetical protein NYP20_14050 [Pseudomonas sp. N3-W]|jgi:hypothetical protein|uniref:hypothetical protein n=1 Tax=Pseudomonas sp. N3-W TaxID=2975049 RepID=UPI00217D179A|nr:hypothetical protein [Pseudomonas sp. N3-W]UWF52016.1 hypothetical protein NYP20_14050 [Pseudomonas sp. N3-W]
MRILIGTVAVMLLAGCSVKPISAENASPISADRQYAFTDKNDVTLLVTRDQGWYQSGHTIDFLIDGTLAAKVRMGEVARFGLKAGSHIIAVSAGGLLVERELNAKSGETIRRRIPDGVTLDVTPTTF